MTEEQIASIVDNQGKLIELVTELQGRVIHLEQTSILRDQLMSKAREMVVSQQDVIGQIIAELLGGLPITRRSTSLN